MSGIIVCMIVSSCCFFFVVGRVGWCGGSFSCLEVCKRRLDLEGRSSGEV